MNFNTMNDIIDVLEPLGVTFIILSYVWFENS